MNITFKQSGNLSKTSQFLEKNKSMKVLDILQRYGALGVTALENSTPVETGLTASSWSFEIKKTGRGYKLSWHNENANGGVPIAILIQYGHATGTGGYVQGRDFINPAMKPIFDSLSEDLRKEVIA